MKKLTFKQHTIVCWGLLIAAVVFALIAQAKGPAANVFLWLSIAAVAIFVVYRLVFVRCPHCGTAITGNGKHCQRCGAYMFADPSEEDTNEETAS